MPVVAVTQHAPVNTAHTSYNVTTVLGTLLYRLLRNITSLVFTVEHSNAIFKTWNFLSKESQ